MAKISPRHALTDDEIDFCRRYKAGLSAAEAFRRAFYTDDSPPPPKTIAKQAAALLKREHIQSYLEEIEGSTSDHARGVLAEQVLFGDPNAARRAAEEVLKQEDKVGFRDAVERWADIMREVGAEIEVPLPADCPHCGEPLYATAQFAEMFPKKERT